MAQLVDLTLPVAAVEDGHATVATEEWALQSAKGPYTGMVYRFNHGSMSGSYIDFPGHIKETDDGADAANFPIEDLFRIEADVIRLDRDTGSGAVTAPELAAACRRGTPRRALVINALGAGLAITCPDCGAEQQVPLPDHVEVAKPAVEPNAVTTAANMQGVEHELPEISDVLADAREQINALKLENDELQFRRRFLEKRHAIASQNLQALRREIAAIRAAVDRVDEILKTMEDPFAGDTQPMA